MKLRRKTLALLGLTFISLILVQYAASQLICLNSFATLEEQDTIQNVERAFSALSAELANLDATTHDWAAWDDSYTFIQDRNEEYIEANLVNETFTNLDLNIIIFVTSSGEIVYGKAFDLENEEYIAFPESIMNHLSPNGVLLQHLDASSTVTGILLIPETPMLVASRPILQSNSEGPILGSLIMGYYLDSTRISNLAERTHLAIEIQRFNDSQTLDFQELQSALADEENVFVKPLDSESIAGYIALRDVYGEHSLVLRVELPRNIYKQGQATIAYFMLLVLTVGITFGVLITLLLEKTVLSKLAQLNTSVNNIRSHGNLSERLPVTGKDEISDLAEEINRMLTTLDQSQNKLHMLNEKLSVVGELTRHDVRNKLSVIANNIYLIKKMTTNDPDALKYLAAIELSVDQVNKIFDFSSTYEKLGAEELSYINVGKSIEEAVMLFSGLDEMRIVNDGQGLTVLADSLLRQLFYNLIDDSLKHGEKVNQISIYYKEEKDQLKLIYEDNGVGIPEEEKEKIFEEGYGKGTGYGLYLIRKICEAYGWTIRETGKLGKGAQFTMTIPEMVKDEKRKYFYSVTC